MNKISLVKIIFLLLAIILLLISSYLNFSNNKIIYSDAKKVFYVVKGDSVTKTIKNLKDNEIIDSSLRFKINTYMYNIRPKFISGKYRISKNEP